MSKALLKDVCSKIGSGSTPRGGKEAYKEEGISIIRSQNVLDFSFSINGLAYIDEDQAEKLKNVIIEKDDVLFNITGDSVARVCSVPDWALPARVNQHVAIIRANQEKLFPAFLKYHLLSPRSKKELLNLSSSGATRNALTKSMIEDFEINLPPLQEQKRIAHILGTLDDKIELNRKMNQTLESMAQALFQSWFVDFDPVLDNALSAGNPIPEPLQKKATKRNQAEASTKLINTNPALAKLFPSTFVFDETLNKWIPERWEVSTLASQYSVKTGYAFKGRDFVDSNGVPAIKIKNIKSDKTIDIDDASLVESDVAISKKEFGLETGDVLMAMTGATVGKFGVLVKKNDELIVLNQRVAKFQTQNERLKSIWFVYCFFNCSQNTDFIINTAQGSAQPNISANEILRAPMITSSISLIEKFEQLVSSTFDKIIQTQIEIDSLIKTRDTLLPKLISGKIKT